MTRHNIQVFNTKLCTYVKYVDMFDTIFQNYLKYFISFKKIILVEERGAYELYGRFELLALCFFLRNIIFFFGFI